MRRITEHRWVALCASVMLLAAAALLVMTQLVVIEVTAAPKPPPPTTTTTTAPAPPPELPCVDPTEVPHFFAGDPGKEHQSSFGPPASPAAESTHQQANAELIDRLCGNAQRGGDRRLLAALVATVDKTDPNVILTHNEWEKMAEEFVGKRAQWDKARLDTLAGGDYLSEFMQLRDGADPLVGSASTSYGPDVVLVLPVRLVDSRKTVDLKLRLRCGFQPNEPEITSLFQMME